MDTMTIAFDDRKMISVLRQLINSMNGVRIIPSDTIVEEEKSVSVSKVKKYRISTTPVVSRISRSSSTAPSRQVVATVIAMAIVMATTTVMPTVTVPSPITPNKI